MYNLQELCRCRLVVLLFVTIISAGAIVGVWHGGARYLTYGSAGSVCCGGTLPFTAPLRCGLYKCRAVEIRPHLFLIFHFILMYRKGVFLARCNNKKEANSLYSVSAFV